MKVIQPVRNKEYCDALKAIEVLAKTDKRIVLAILEARPDFSRLLYLPITQE